MNLHKNLALALLCLASLSAAAQDEAPAASADVPQEAAPVADAPASAEEAAVIPVQPLAPQAAPEVPADEADKSATRLDDVVVTATKRATPTRKIASTLTVLSGEDLEREGVQGIDQIVSKVPGVAMNSDEGGGDPKRITIRGVASMPATNFTVGTLFGDVPFSDPFVPKVQLDPNPFDMATVEVLKGPQGTLFGGTGLNGMIRYVPEAPQFDGVHIKYYTQYNAYPGNGDGGFSYGAVLNTPFAGDAAALRIMAFNRQQPGYVDDTQSGKKDINSSSQYGFRGAVAWHPDDRWKISLLVTTQHTSTDDLGYTDNFDGQLVRGDSPRPDPSVTRYSLGNLGIEREFDWGSFVSQTSAFSKDFRSYIDGSRIALGGKVPLLGAGEYNHSHGYSQEFRLVSPDNDSKWKWIAGAFLYDTHLYDCNEIGAGQLAILPALALPPSLQGLVASPCPQNASKLAGTLDIAQLIGDIELKEAALFGELTRELSEHWDATVGARVYRTSSSGTVSNAGALYSAQNAGAASSRDAGASDPGVSPKASIVYHPTDELRGYFTVARGFRFGGPQLGASTPTTTVPSSYKSDSLWSYELGLRSDWLDQSLRVDASLYHLDWKDPQVRQQSNDGLAVFIDNVGGVSANGVDLSLRYLPPFLNGLSLASNVSWNRTVTTAEFNDAGGAKVPSGSPWPMSPRWQTSTTLAYALPLDAWRSGVALRHTYWGQACNAIACTHPIFGFRTLDFDVSLASLEHSWLPEVSVGVDNLTDERGLSNVNITNLDSVITVNTISYIAPRSLMVRLSGSF